MLSPSAERAQSVRREPTHRPLETAARSSRAPLYRSGGSRDPLSIRIALEQRIRAPAREVPWLGTNRGAQRLLSGEASDGAVAKSVER